MNIKADIPEAKASAKRTIPQPAKLAHIVLRTSRYEEMFDWYKTLFDASITFKDEHIAFITYDEEHHRVAFINIPGLKDQEDGVAGVHHVAFTYGALDDLLTHYERMKALGVEPIVTINHGPTVSFYYRDPDGNQVECQVDSYPTIEESKQFFYTDQFAVNPIGVDVDPAELRRRLDAGEPEAELKLRPHSGPRAISDIKLR